STSRPPSTPPSRAAAPPARGPVPPPSTPPLAAAPDPTIGRRVRQPLAQLRQQRRRQHGGGRPVASAQVAQRRRTLGVVAGQQLLDPAHAERRHLRYLGDRVALRQQPYRLQM